MVNKGRIHKEIGNFSRCIQNLIKPNNELRWEISEIVFFAKKTPQKSMELKFTQFELVFVEKSRSKIKRENLIAKIEKLNKIRKIKLIYRSKLKI